MANFEISDELEFSEEIRKLESTDRAHADIFNEVIGKVFENTVSNRNAIQLAEIQTTTSKILNRSKEGGLRFNKILGKSEQKTFSWIGKNLLNTNHLVEETINEVTFTPIKDENGFLEYINVNGTASNDAIFPLNDDYFRVIGGQKYIINGCPTGGASNTYWIQSTGTTAGPSGTTGDSGSNTSPFYFGTDGAGIKFAIVIKNGITVSNLKFYPMLRMAEIEDGSYEPYCGGSPVPNPIYQSELKEVVIRGIKTVGKNFFNIHSEPIYSKGVNIVVNDENISLIVTGLSLFAQIYFEFDKNLAGKTIVFSVEDIIAKTNATISSDNCPRIYMYYEVDGKEYHSSIFYTSSTKNKAITIPKEAINIRFVLRAFQSADGYAIGDVITFVKPQIEIGSSYTGYAPYQESIIEFSSPITLRGIGDVRDVLGRNEIERSIKRVVFDGNENWSSQSSSFLNKLVFNTNIESVPNRTTNSVGSGLCNYFKWNNAANDVANTVRFTNGSTNTIWFYPSSFKTIDEWKSWLTEKYESGNPVTLDYVLAESEYEELPIVDKIALNSLETFDNVTYITVDSEIEPDTEVDFGTSKNSAYTLQGLNIAERTELYAKNIVNGNEVEY